MRASAGGRRLLATQGAMSPTCLAHWRFRAVLARL